MTRKKEQLLSSILQAQTLSPSPGDWILQVYKDMEDLEMPQEHKYYENITTIEVQRDSKTEVV